MTEHIDVVMKRLPGPDSDFVELEDDQRRGIGPVKGVEWVERGNGLYALRIPASLFADAPSGGERAAADMVSGEVWAWLNRHDAPWSPSDATVNDLAFRVAGRVETVRPIQPGDMVVKVSAPELDDREVIAVGRDWLTLDILGRETERLPKDNYQTSVPAEGVL